MKLVTGIMTAVLFIGAGSHALASMAEPAPRVEVQSVSTGDLPTSESAGESAQELQTGMEYAVNNSGATSETTDPDTPNVPSVLITGNVTPSSTSLDNLASLARTLDRGHGGFFFDNAESPTACISIVTVSPLATSIRVLDVQSSADMQPSSTPVPLPPPLLLAGSGLTGLIAIRRKIRPA